MTSGKKVVAPHSLEQGKLKQAVANRAVKWLTPCPFSQCTLEASFQAGNNLGVHISVLWSAMNSLEKSSGLEQAWFCTSMQNGKIITQRQDKCNSNFRVEMN